MANQAFTSSVTHQGLNRESKAVLAATLTSTLASGETLDMTLPDTIDPDLVPVWFRAYNQATPAVELSGPAEANLRITNHNRTTGVTRLTGAGAGIASGSHVLVGYAAAPPIP